MFAFASRKGKSWRHMAPVSVHGSRRGKLWTRAVMAITCYTMSVTRERHNAYNQGIVK
jgi:hypothetical protein